MDRYVELMLDLFADRVHLAPGSEATTRRALDALGVLGESPRIADLGCGRGASALVLAQATGGHVLAIDSLPDMVTTTRARAAAAGLTARVDAVVGDIADPPIAPGSLDLVWSEGAAYAIGFERALTRWRPLLATGGGIGVSEICWTTASPPDGARSYWAEAYAGMRHEGDLRRAFDVAGYDPVASFLVPEDDWSAYYAPTDAALPGFRARHAGDDVAQRVADDMAAEADAWRRWSQHVGYLFLVGRSAGTGGS